MPFFWRKPTRRGGNVGFEAETRQIRHHQFESLEWIRDEPGLAIDVALTGTALALVKSLSSTFRSQGQVLLHGFTHIFRHASCHRRRESVTER
jgi:hypothetical protein